MTTELLTDPKHIRGDLQLMEQAVKRSTVNPEIPIPPAVIDAMSKVAGTILVKGKQREQLAAGRLLLSFMEYNKSLTDPVPQPQATQINVGVNVDNRTDERRVSTSSIAKRIREERLLRDSDGG